MKTQLENDILTQCGWDSKQKDFQGVMVYKVQTENNKNIAHLVTKLNDVEMIIEFSVPDGQGEKLTMVFNRKNQIIDIEKSDAEINNEESMKAFLSMIESTIKGIKGVFMPTRKDEVNNKYTM